jgi:hypothetical protein
MDVFVSVIESGNQSLHEAKEGVFQTMAIHEIF